jgi:hypothetical protein
MMEAPMNYSPNKLEELVVLNLGLVKVSSMAGLCIHPSNSLWVPRKVSSPLISTRILFYFQTSQAWSAWCAPLLCLAAGDAKCSSTVAMLITTLRITNGTYAINPSSDYCQPWNQNVPIPMVFSNVNVMVLVHV